MKAPLTELSRPPGWDRQQLWTLAPRVAEKGHPDADPLSVYLELGVIPRSSREDNHNRLGADLSNYLRVQPGDLVFNKLRTWQGGLGVSQYHGIVSPAYFVCRPIPGITPHYLHHLLRSAPYLAELTRLSKWMPPSQFDISWDQLRTLPILLPPLTEQRRIADFLDDQVARLDRAIALREKQAALANESFDAYWSAQILGLGDPSSWVPLRRVLRSITDGPFGSSLTSAHYSSSGARVIRLGNLGEAMFRPRDEAFIPMSYYETLMEHAAMPGDLLVAGLGDENHPLGRACLVPPDLGPAIVKADCFRVRLDQRLMDHEFAAWALSSPPVTAETQVVGRGATRARINTVTAREMRLPVPDLATQKEVVVRLRQRRVDVEQAKSALRKSLDLLTDRKQALITAAVTGAFDVTTARAVAS